MRTRRLVALLPILLGLIVAVPVRGAGARARTLAYVSNLFSGTISVLDLDRLAWLHDFSVGPYPIFSLADPHDGTRMLLALHNYDHAEDEDALLLVDLEAEKVIKRIPYPGAGMPSGFVYDEKRDRIYIADENLHRIFVHDGTTLELLSDYPAGLIPVHVDISPDGRWLVSTARKSAELYVYDLENIGEGAKSAVYTVRLGPSPGLEWDEEEATEDFSHPVDVKFGIDPNTCYVTDTSRSAFLYVDLAKREVTDRIDLKTPPFDFCLTSDGTLAYVCQIDANSLSVLNLKERRIVAEIPGLESNPIHCALDEEGRRLLVACFGDGKSGGVYVVDLESNTVLERIVPPAAKGSIGITILWR